MANLRFDFTKEHTTLERALTLYLYLLSLPKDSRPFPLNYDTVSDEDDERIRAESLRNRAYLASAKEMRQKWGI